MNLANLMENLRSAKLYPICIKVNSDRGSANDFTFIGNLDEYVAAVKALKSDIVFVSNQPFTESDFMYESDNEEDDEGDDDFADDRGVELPTEIYLPSIMPTLEKFKEFVGQDSVFKLSAPMLNNSLDFYIQEDWWLEFQDQYSNAINEIEENKEAVRAKLAADREQRERKLLEQLRNLIKDNDFVRLPTQRAMQAYALEKIPELESLNGSTLRTEIQSIDAKVKARGLNRKR